MFSARICVAKDAVLGSFEPKILSVQSGGRQEFPSIDYGQFGQYPAYLVITPTRIWDYNTYGGPPLFNNPDLNVKEIDSGGKRDFAYYVRWNGVRRELKMKPSSVIYKTFLSPTFELVYKTIDGRMAATRFIGEDKRFPMYFSTPEKFYVFPITDSKYYPGISIFLESYVWTVLFPSDHKYTYELSQKIRNQSVPKSLRTIIRWRGNKWVRIITPYHSQRLRGASLDYMLFADKNPSAKYAPGFEHIPNNAASREYYAFHWPASTLYSPRTGRSTKFYFKNTKSEKFVTCIGFVATKRLAYAVNLKDRTEVRVRKLP